MTDRVVVVVGGSSGIGLATALRFAADGARLVLAARSETALARAAQHVRDAGASDVRTVALDVRRADAVQFLVDFVVETHGRLDVVVHTATTMAYGRIEDVPDDIFTSVVDTAIHGTANLARAVLPEFRRRHAGTFVIVNSLLGGVTVPQMGAYATAKWGQRAIARTLQQELRGEKDVHISIVSPGSTNTPIYYQAANYLGFEARPPVPVLPASWAARLIARLATRPRRHVSTAVGPGNAAVVLGFRALPNVYDRLVGPLFGLAVRTRSARAPTDGNVCVPRPDGERVHGHWPDRGS